MGRGKKSGMVWRPIEYVMIGFAISLIIFLVWMLREIRHEDAQTKSGTTVVSEDESHISQIIERGLEAEQQVDATYDAWEEASNSGVDSAADDMGGAVNESSY